MNFWGLILKLTGWKVNISAPRRDKCVICVAPHTSNWDFILGLLAYYSIGRKANFLMKKFWFFFPLNFLLKSLGGIPVYPKGSGGNLSQQIINRFNNQSYLNLAVTPEGTRSATSEWRTGFLHIAVEAHVPVQLGIIDYKHKSIEICEEVMPSGNIEEDLRNVKYFYSHHMDAALYPEKFKL